MVEWDAHGRDVDIRCHTTSAVQGYARCLPRRIENRITWIAKKSKLISSLIWIRIYPRLSMDHHNSNPETQTRHQILMFSDIFKMFPISAETSRKSRSTFRRWSRDRSTTSAWLFSDFWKIVALLAETARYICMSLFSISNAQLIVVCSWLSLHLLYSLYCIHFICTILLTPSHTIQYTHFYACTEQWFYNISTFRTRLWNLGTHLFLGLRPIISSCLFRIFRYCLSIWNQICMTGRRSDTEILYRGVDNFLRRACTRT